MNDIIDIDIMTCHRLETILVYLLVFVWSIITEAPSSNTIDYNHQEKWGGFCRTNKYLQSPISLQLYPVTRMLYFEPLQILNRGEMMEAIVQKNTSQLNVILSNHAILKGGHLTGRFYANLSFHMPAEHVINEGRLELEIHLHLSKYHDVGYHDRDELRDLTTTMAILSYSDPFATSHLNEFVDAFDKANDKDNDAASVIINTALNFFLPEDLSVFYEYEGSRTTPPCDGPFNWTVLHDKLPVHPDAMSRLREHVNGGEPNNRDIMKSEHREVRMYISKGSALRYPTILYTTLFWFICRI